MTIARIPVAVHRKICTEMTKKPGTGVRAGFSIMPEIRADDQNMLNFHATPRRSVWSSTSVRAAVPPRLYHFSGKFV